MASHDDRDSPIPSKLLRELADKGALQSPSEALASLQRRGEEMTLRRENLVTAGVDGEQVLLETRAKGLLIRRLPDDPDRVLRVSIGVPTFDDQQGYLVFRGDLQKVYDLVRRAEKALRRLSRAVEPATGEGCKP